MKLEKLYDLYDSNINILSNEEHQSSRYRLNEGDIDDMLDFYLELFHNNINDLIHMLIKV